MNRIALINEYVSRYKARIRLGLKTYGKFDPAKDTRVLAVEAQYEVLDVGSYMEFCAIKHPVLDRKCKRVVSRAILLYELLLDLEQDERALTQAKEGEN